MCVRAFGRVCSHARTSALIFPLTGSDGSFQQEPPKQPETEQQREPQPVAKSQMTKPLAPIESGVEECDLCGRSVVPCTFYTASLLFFLRVSCWNDAGRCDLCGNKHSLTNVTHRDIFPDRKPPSRAFCSVSELDSLI